MTEATEDRNVAPLVLTIVENFGEKTEGLGLEAMILNAAVHGWMEGHLAAPGHTFDRNNAGEMPEPPFPPADSEAMRAMVHDAAARFSGGEEPAAVAYAAALGWQAGRQAGLDCPGCSPKEGDHPFAEFMRAGRVDIRFHGPEERIIAE